MTPIAPVTIHHPRTLLKRDLCTAATTAAMLFSWAFAAHNLSVATEPTVQRTVTGDAIRISQHVCRKNDGVRTIEPAENKVRFVCRDGAIFEDVVIDLRGEK